MGMSMNYRVNPRGQSPRKEAKAAAPAAWLSELEQAEAEIDSGVSPGSFDDLLAKARAELAEWDSEHNPQP